VGRLRPAIFNVKRLLSGGKAALADRFAGGLRLAPAVLRKEKKVERDVEPLANSLPAKA